jgi:hypothetical protein
MYGNIDLGNLFKEINQESITIALQKDNEQKGSGVFTAITGTQEGNDLFALTAQIENELTDIDKGTQLLANSIIAANKEMFNTKESQQLSYNIIASEAYALGIACTDVSSEDFMDKVKELKNTTIALIERIVRWIKNKISEISDSISVWISTARANTESKVKKTKTRIKIKKTTRKTEIRTKTKKTIKAIKTKNKILNKTSRKTAKIKTKKDNPNQNLVEFLKIV